MCFHATKQIVSVFDLPHSARQGYAYYDHKEARSNSLGNGYFVSCDYLPSALSRSQSPADMGPPPLNFIVDYLGERGEEQCCCIKLIGSDRSEEEASDVM